MRRRPARHLSPSRNRTVPDRAERWGTLVHARRHAGLTQVELATRIGVSQSTLARWENDMLLPSLADRLRLAHALGLPPRELCTIGPAKDRVRSKRGEPRSSRWIGLAVREARLDAGVDLVACARAAHLSARRLRRLEEGAEPAMGELLRLVRVLRVSLDELLESRDARRT